MFVRSGWTVNVKRVRRLWIDLGLKRPVRLKKPRKLGPKPGTSANSCVQQPARFKNDVWTCDFIHDRTADGRSLKWLTLVDESTRECLVLHAAGSLGGADVRRIVARVIGRRGAPTRIRGDNGSEFIREALTGWLLGAGAKPIPVGRPAPGRTATSNRSTAASATSFWSGSSLSRRPTPAPRARGSAANTTPCDRTAR